MPDRIPTFEQFVRAVTKKEHPPNGLSPNQVDPRFLPALRANYDQYVRQMRAAQIPRFEPIAAKPTPPPKPVAPGSPEALWARAFTAEFKRKIVMWFGIASDAIITWSPPEPKPMPEALGLVIDQLDSFLADSLPGWGLASFAFKVALADARHKEKLRRDSGAAEAKRAVAAALEDYAKNPVADPKIKRELTKHIRQTFTKVRDDFKHLDATQRVIAEEAFLGAYMERLVPINSQEIKRQIHGRLSGAYSEARRAADRRRKEMEARRRRELARIEAQRTAERVERERRMGTGPAGTRISQPNSGRVINK